jgi:hypothetical protein
MKVTESEIDIDLNPYKDYKKEDIADVVAKILNEPILYDSDSDKYITQYSNDWFLRITAYDIILSHRYSKPLYYMTSLFIIISTNLGLYLEGALLGHTWKEIIKGAYKLGG